MKKTQKQFAGVWIDNQNAMIITNHFKSVSTLLLNYDEILVFGPGKSQEQFQNHLKHDAQFKSKQITIESAEQLTDPQMIAKVRDFFKGRNLTNKEKLLF
jgi:hypothetical protein